MELLKHYNPQTEQEKNFKGRMLRLYRDKSNLAFMRKSIEAHFTASAWIINPENREVLLIHHKKLNKWLQPGGHADGEVDLEKVARKEAREETSLHNLQLATSDVFDIDIHLIPEHKGIQEHYHYDVRFAYFCTCKDDTQINSESNSFQWIKIDQVKTLTKEPSILRMVKKTKSILDG